MTFFGSKITVDGEYSHKIKRHLFLGRKAITNLDSVLKSRDITLPIKVHLESDILECEVKRALGSITMNKVI